ALILKRCEDITNYLLKEYKIDALIDACNTATSAAIKHLSDNFSSLIVIGTEPGIKPAILYTKSSNIGIFATPSTLKSDK
ncbi:glutamate racemase, partial [Aliarcobacter butzleri]